MKCQGGWITGWNQYCQEKYQQLQICIWYLSKGIKWREIKEPLDEGEKESEKAGLKLNIQKTKIMALSPITSWQIGKNWKQLHIFFSWASKSPWMVTAPMKLKDAFSWKESYDKLNVLKSRDITLPIKVHIVKATVFPVVMYRCESWSIKKAECQRIDVFELWCWRRLLKLSWKARRSNQSILEEINSEYCKDWCWS